MTDISNDNPVLISYDDYQKMVLNGTKSVKRLRITVKEWYYA